MSLTITCAYAKTQVNTGTISVAYGYIHASSNGSVNGKYEHRTAYELTGALVTGGVWVEDGWGNVDTKSASRDAGENTRYTYVRAKLISGSANHYHYYQYWKDSL